MTSVNVANMGLVSIPQALFPLPGIERIDAHQNSLRDIRGISVWGSSLTHADFVQNLLEQSGTCDSTEA